MYAQTICNIDERATWMLRQPEEELRTYNRCCSKKNITRTLQIEQASNKHLRQAHASKNNNNHSTYPRGWWLNFPSSKLSSTGCNQTNSAIPHIRDGCMIGGGGLLGKEAKRKQHVGGNERLGYLREVRVSEAQERCKLAAGRGIVPGPR